MKNLFFFLMLILPLYAIGQVVIEKSASQIEKEQAVKVIEAVNRNKVTVYDSLSNRVPSDSLFLLIGQNIIVKPHDRDKKPYDGFYLKNGKKYAEIELPYLRTGCAYDSLVGRRFKIIAYKKDYPNKIYFTDEKDTLYLDPSSQDYYIEGYLSKLSERYVGKKFARVVSSFDNDPIDFKTGKPVKLKVGDIWIVDRVIIDSEDGRTKAILRNSLGNQLSETIEDWLSFFDLRYKPKADSDKWKRKYGVYCWKKILQNEIYVGMPASAVKLAWGEPEYINNASYGDQWVYSNGYVYIKNGKVTSWN